MSDLTTLMQTCQSFSLNMAQCSSFQHDLHMSTCRHLIYHGDDLCNNPGVMKLVTQAAICYWFHANAFDSWWRLALALNGAVSWWVDSFVVLACTPVETDTDNVNNPVRAADDIYWALIFNLGNKCVPRVFTAQRFPFICWAFTRITGTAPLAVSYATHSADSLSPLFTHHLFTSCLFILVSFCRKLYCLLKI